MSQVDIPRRLEGFESNIEVQRIALTGEDIGDPELPSFSAEDKRKDPRYPWFARRYGHRCWELDALNPNILRTRLEQIIYQVIDHDAWERCKRAQEAERASLTTILNTWKGYTA
jgi:hypothetical protein